MENEWIVVHVAQGELEETQIRSFLGAHGIPTSTRGEALRKTHGFVLDGLGEAVRERPQRAQGGLLLLQVAEQGEEHVDVPGPGPPARDEHHTSFGRQGRRPVSRARPQRVTRREGLAPLVAPPRPAAEAALLGDQEVRVAERLRDLGY